MNSLNLVARLTRDPETRFLPDGKAVANFGIAFDVGFGDKKKTVFLDCAIWGKRAETFAKYVFKGHQVGLSGSLDQDEWADKATGIKKTKVKMQVNDFTLLSNKEAGQKQATTSRPMSRQEERPPTTDDGGPNDPAAVEEDEIPW
jgi:single-strand DNA-binding protein